MSRPETVLAILSCALPAYALEPAVGHVELDPHHQAGAWEWRTYWYDNDLNERTDAVETLFFPGTDSPPASLGVRNTRPADPKWDFLGVAAGEPVWIFTGTSYVSAGFADTQADLSGTLDFTLDSVTGPAGGFFSMYEGSTPIIHMQTIDGIGPADLFQKPSYHTHVNWAFSRKGLWIVNLKVSGTIASSGNPTVQSPAQSLVFAIGDYARWKAAHFSMEELKDPAISGDGADPDGDGWNNLMEYALGGDCHSASQSREDDGLPLAPRLVPPARVRAAWQLQFYRRKAVDEPASIYQVESATSPGASAWSGETAGAEVISEDSVWELVSVPLEEAQSGTAALFHRLKVTVDP